MRIVVGLDGSDASLVAHELVARTRWPNGTTIRLVGAYERSAGSIGQAGVASRVDRVEQPQLPLRDRLQALAEPLGQREYRTEAVVGRGTAADLLSAEADDLGADLIVVGSRGRGVATSALLGSVSAALIDHAACPVLVARRPQVTRVLIATDGSRSAEAIPVMLADWGIFRDAPIDVVTVAPLGDSAGGTTVTWMLGGKRQVLDASHEVDRHRVTSDDMAARLRAAGWRAESAVRVGDAAREIEAAAAESGSDLIITGSRGLSGLQRLFLGSVAHHVLLHSPTSVLVLRGHAPGREQSDAVAG